MATRLDTQARSMYYRVPNKSALLQLMADRPAQQAYDAGADALAALPDGAGRPERVPRRGGLRAGAGPGGAGRPITLR
ncbi:hypothetical protein AB0N93_15290 [Streptomyces sp. NPDC091267]|uniref:hypothetical protein n=1 Tax=unclassified Streptomyces TaxID=2593676 RepID=UPI0034415175